MKSDGCCCLICRFLVVGFQLVHFVLPIALRSNARRGIDQHQSAVDVHDVEVSAYLARKKSRYCHDLASEPDPAQPFQRVPLKPAFRLRPWCNLHDRRSPFLAADDLDVSFASAGKSVRRQHRANRVLPGFHNVVRQGYFLALDFHCGHHFLPLFFELFFAADFLLAATFAFEAARLAGFRFACRFAVDFICRAVLPPVTFFFAAGVFGTTGSPLNASTTITRTGSGSESTKPSSKVCDLNLLRSFPTTTPTVTLPFNAESQLSVTARFLPFSRSETFFEGVCVRTGALAAAVTGRRSAVAFGGTLIVLRLRFSSGMTCHFEPRSSIMP